MLLGLSGGRDMVGLFGGGIDFLLILQIVPKGCSCICIRVLSFLFWKLARKSARRLCWASLVAKRMSMAVSLSKTSMSLAVLLAISLEISSGAMVRLVCRAVNHSVCASRIHLLWSVEVSNRCEW